MGLSGSEKTGYAVCLVLTILLIALHYAGKRPFYIVATQGYYFAQDAIDHNVTHMFNPALYLKEQKQEAAFIIVAAGLTFFISLFLLVGLCTDCISPKLKHFLSAFNLVLEFSIAVVVALRASNNSNLRDLYGDL